MRLILRCLALGIALHAAGLCVAAPPANAEAVPSASTASAPTTCLDADLSNVRVEKVATSGSSAASASAALRGEITLEVRGLKTLLSRAKCAKGSREVILFLDGRPVPKAFPYPPVAPGGEKLNFQLERREESREVWSHLLGRPSFDDRPVAVSVGLADEYPVASDAKIYLNVIPKRWFITWTVVLVVLLAAFITLAIRSDVVRDTVTEVAGSRKPYSLAKMQAAWWFFLILSSYLFIGLITGDYNTSITGTVLSLMGISAFTAVGSAVIDAGKREAAAVAASAAVAAGGTAAAPPVTRGKWWLDIVSDEKGVNFHRFQMAAWTAVLGVIFVHDVYAGLAMPQFDNTLLGLLGISSGTYLGLKTTSEKT